MICAGEKMSKNFDRFQRELFCALQTILICFFGGKRNLRNGIILPYQMISSNTEMRIRVCLNVL